MAEFDLDAFIAGVNSDRTQTKNPKDKLNRLLMNTKNYQGMVSFLPIMSKGSKNFYLKLPRVYELYLFTSLLTGGEAWFKILPLECYGDLSPEEMSLYNEVKGYLDKLMDEEIYNYEWVRVRNYVLFNGICLSLKNNEGKSIDEYNDCPCLFTYPSNSVIDAFGTALNAKIDTMKGRKDWIPMILSPNNTGRKGLVQISFNKAAGPGYDSAVQFELNSEFNQVVDPSMVIPDEVISKFDDVIPTFIGWSYDSTNKRYFNVTAFREALAQCKQKYAEAHPELASQAPADQNKTYENKNGEAVNPGTQESTAAAPKKTPF